MAIISHTNLTKPKVKTRPDLAIPGIIQQEKMMFIQMSIHYPKPEYEPQIIDSMHRFGAAMKTQHGLQRIHTLKDDISGRLIGLAIWDSREDMMAARPAMEQAVKDDDFDLWEEREPELFALTEK